MKKLSIGLTNPSEPFICDTDPETSIGPHRPIGSLQESRRSNLTKSLFNVTFKDLEAHHPSIEFKNYEKQLNQELKDWKKHISEALRNLRQVEEKPLVVDLSILPKEKREFIDQAPDFARFLRRMQEFRGLVVKFMENDYPEMLTLQQNVADVCKERLNSAKENFLEERLARGAEIS